MVSTAKDLTENPQLVARDWMFHVEQAGEPLDLPGPPYRLSATPVRIRRPAPTIGEHNLEVWEGEVGLPRAEVEVYMSEGAM